MKPWVLGVLFFAAFPAWAQMYKCVDERGVTHYSDNPGAGCKGVKVNIQASPPLGDAPSRGDGVPIRRGAMEQDAEFKRRQAERERAEQEQKAALDERCGGLREEYARLASGIRLGSINSQGERVYLDDASRDARLAQVKGELRGCP
jgi:hypothetical protein